METSTPTISAPSSQLERVRHKLGHAHAGGHFDGKASILPDRVDAADAQAGIGDNLQFVAGLDARTSAIHAATQRVPLPLISAIEPSALCRRMRPDFGPVHEKNSMPSAPMPVLRRQSRRVRSGAIVVGHGFFGHDQKIVAAGVGLGKGNQSSSEYGK